ncbi:MAG: hypothetical protein JWL85_694 [Candidatus Saccharibacteria bacterium]|nr:hypothetical protein [Candidatus Saccharibacteria bacterium]
MHLYLAHAGEDHAATGDSNTFMVVLGVTLVALTIGLVVIVFLSRKAAKPKTDKPAQTEE